MSSRTQAVILVAVIILGFIWLIVASQNRISWTVDEARWIAAGKTLVSKGFTGQPDEISHPLLFMLLHGKTNQWFAGKTQDSLVATSRLSLLPFHLVCLVCIAIYSFKRYGVGGAVISTGFLAFSPNYLAHAALVTTDAMLADVVFLSCLAFNSHLTKPSWKTGACLTATLTLGCLSKFSYIMIPVFFLFWSFLLVARKRKKIKTLIIWWLLPVLGCVFFVNAFYAFHGSFEPLNTIPLQSKILTTLSESFLGSWPFPLPEYYIRGMDLHLTFFGEWPSFLLGKISRTGWAGYDLFAFLVKTSSVSLILFFLTGISGIWKRFTKEEMMMISMAAAWLLYFSFVHRVDCGVRYILPVYPLLFYTSGRLTAIPVTRRIKGYVVAGALLIGQLLISITSFPHYISFFNAFSGGSSKGYLLLGDSNISWGQTLKALGKYQKDHGLGTIVFGLEKRAAMVDPYVDYRPITHKEKYFPSTGVFAIWIASLQTLLHDDPNAFLWFRMESPETIIGNAMYVYNVDVEPGQEMAYFRKLYAANLRDGFRFPWAQDYLHSTGGVFFYPIPDIPEIPPDGEARITVEGAPPVQLVALESSRTNEIPDIILETAGGAGVRGTMLPSEESGKIYTIFPGEIPTTHMILKNRVERSICPEVFFVYYLQEDTTMNPTRNSN